MERAAAGKVCFPLVDHRGPSAAISKLNDQSFAHRKLMANEAKSPGSRGDGPRRPSR